MNAPLLLVGISIAAPIDPPAHPRGGDAMAIVMPLRSSRVDAGLALVLGEMVQAELSRRGSYRVLSEEDLQALLGADVSYKVVKSFIATVGERAVGEEVLRSISPGQQVVKIVHDSLVDLMGPVDHSLAWSPKRPTVILIAGPQ